MNPRSPNRGHARIGWITALLVTLTLPRLDAHASTPPPSEAIEPAPPTPTLEVELTPTIPDASDLSEWIHEEGTKALADLPPSPDRRGTIRVSVSGTLYDYDVSIITIREGSTEEETTTWPCECTNDALLARIRTEVQSAAKSLDPPEPPPPPVVPDRKSPLGLHGKIGFGLLGGGAAFTILGLSLTAASDPGDASRKAGIPILTIGMAALAAGTTLIVLDHRRDRARRTQSRVTVVPFATHRAAHLGIAGRF